MSAFGWQSLQGWLAPTDQQLMWRLQTQDDAEAFAELVRRWEGAILKLCARMTGDFHRSQDLTQEAFARLFAHRKTYQCGGKFSTYLWRIALNLCYSELRRGRRRRETPIEVVAEAEADRELPLTGDSPSPDYQVVRQEQVEAVRSAMMDLPEEHRVIILLRHYEGLKFREIAEVLDLPEGTVKTRMVEALNRLGKRLIRTLELEVPPPLDSRSRPKECLIL